MSGWSFWDRRLHGQEMGLSASSVSHTCDGPFRLEFMLCVHCVVLSVSARAQSVHGRDQINRFECVGKWAVVVQVPQSIPPDTHTLVIVHFTLSMSSSLHPPSVGPLPFPWPSPPSEAAAGLCGTDLTLGPPGDNDHYIASSCLTVQPLSYPFSDWNSLGCSGSYPVPISSHMCPQHCPDHCLYGGMVDQC